MLRTGKGFLNELVSPLCIGVSRMIVFRCRKSRFPDDFCRLGFKIVGRPLSVAELCFWLQGNFPLAAIFIARGTDIVEWVRKGPFRRKRESHPLLVIS